MAVSEESLKTLFADVFQQITKRSVSPEIHVSFYPFAGLNHTIRIRKQRVYVRVSDILRDAPRPVHHALAHILVGKLFNKKVTREYEALYREYAYQPHVLRASDLARRQRGRKQLNGAAGRVYDLDKIFDRLNRRYFNNELPKPALSWSARRTKRILGHHDSVHDAIVISRSLDHPDTPQFLVEYVLYHEMLHIKHRPRIVNGRRLFHTNAFRAEEKRFDRYEEAIAHLERLTKRRS